MRHPVAVIVLAQLFGTSLWFSANSAADDLVQDAADRMREAKIDQLPVVDERRRPVGLLDVQDLLSARFL